MFWKDHENIFFEDLRRISHFKLILLNTSPRACHLPESDQVHLLSNSLPVLQDFITDCKSIFSLLQLWCSAHWFKSLWVPKVMI